MIKYYLKRLWKYFPQKLRHILITVYFFGRRGVHNPLAPLAPLYVLGAFASSSGLAESARLYAHARKAEGLDVICLDITRAMEQRVDYSEEIAGVVSFDQRHTLSAPGTIVIHANPPHFQLTLARLGSDFMKNKRIVGYWAWEVEALPPVWLQALRIVDAVEVPSRFVQQALQVWTNKTVIVVPHVVTVPSRRKAEFMSDGILRCLYCFDVSSGMNRKNPMAVLRAFAEAFPCGEAELTFKVCGSSAAPHAMLRLRDACASIPHVCIITDILDRDGMTDLYCRHDVYISLHRSEGYGLTIREAMLHGLYVVATGWSGNMDFMNGELACPVPFRLVPIDQESGPLKGLNGKWAEADISAAAAQLRLLYNALKTKNGIREVCLCGSCL